MDRDNKKKRNSNLVSSIDLSGKKNLSKAVILKLVLIHWIVDILESMEQKFDR